MSSRPQLDAVVSRLYRFTLDHGRVDRGFRAQVMITGHELWRASPVWLPSDWSRSGHYLQSGRARVETRLGVLLPATGRCCHEVRRRICRDRQVRRPPLALMSRTAISLEEPAPVLDVDRKTACGQLPRLNLGWRVIVLSTMVIVTAVRHNFGHLSVGSISLRW
jgi:hypothetical protein